jgi:hypothetical protein
MAKRTRAIAVFALFSLLAFMPSSESQDHAQNPVNNKSQTETKSVVYVCACLKTKSCSCMTEAKMEGPCACGTKGGPPLKAVSSDSSWAKDNREALAR